MVIGNKSNGNYINIRTYTVVTVLVWTFFAAALASWNIGYQCYQTLEIAENYAEATSSRDHLIRAVFSYGLFWILGLIGIGVCSRHLANRLLKYEDLNSRLREATTKANDMALQAASANAAKSQFLANMSHEIRTPMSSVTGMLDLALAEPLNDKAIDYLRTAKVSANALLAVLNDTLDISKIEAGKVRIEIIDCSLKCLLSEIDAFMRPKAGQKGIDFDVCIDTPVPDQIRTDPTRLRQCLLNLVGNAIKFTDTGYVRVHVGRRDEKDGAILIFDVEDTGVGVEPDKQEIIFDAFTQADNSTTRKFGGTGLGLAITKNLISLLGGTVSLVSTPGKGSTFSLTVPAGVAVGNQPLITEFDRDQMIVEATPVFSARFSGKTLVVEDDLANQKTTLAILRKLGLEAEVANDGEQAIQKATAEHFDLIFMDMHMPKMDGYDATRELRRRGLTVPIIALTASVMRNDSDKCLMAGCSHFLAKPIEGKKLIHALTKYLPPANSKSEKQEGEDKPFTSEREAVGTATDEVDPCDERMSGHELPKQIPMDERSDQTIEDVIDWPELVDRVGDESLIKEILSSFLTSNAERLDLLIEAVRGKNVEDATALTHAIKGSAATVAAKPLCQAVDQLNRAAKADNLMTFELLLAQIKAEFDRVKTLLSRPDWIEIVKTRSEREPD